MRRLLARCVLTALAAAGVRAEDLSEIYGLALQHDAKLRAAEASYRANLEQENQAFSRLLPQLSADGSYSSNHRLLDTHELNNTSTGIVKTDQHRDSSLREGLWEVNLSQSLFDLSTWFDFKSGKATSAQARAQFAYDQQDLIVRVAKAYFDALRETENVQASMAEESANQEQWQQNQARFKSGVVGISDVDQAQAEFELSRAKRLTDEGHLAAAYEALTAITGRAHDHLALLDAAFVVANPQPEDRSEWVQFALRNNYALKAAQSAEDAAREKSSSKRSEHLPKVTGSLSYQDDTVYGQQTLNPDSPYTLPPGSDSHTTVAAVKVTMPLYSGGYTSSQARQAYEEYNNALEKKIDTQRTLIQNTRSSFISAQTNVHRVKAQSIAIGAARSALDATRAGYKAGTKSIVDVLQTQRTLFAAIRDHANSRYDYVQNMLQLKQFAGILSPQDVYDLNKWLVASNAGQP